MGNRVKKTFQIESRFDDKLILVIRNFDIEQSNINKEMGGGLRVMTRLQSNTVARKKAVLIIK